jgi:hypothetical protein
VFPPVLPADQQTSFAVSQPLDSLIFHHTALCREIRLPWTDNETVGHYRLQYDDGTEELLPLKNCGNVGPWNHRQNRPMPQKLYRHTGYHTVYETDGEQSKTPDGGDVTVYRLEHILPQNKRLTRVTLEQNPAHDLQIFLLKAEGVLKI